MFEGAAEDVVRDPRTSSRRSSRTARSSSPSARRCGRSNGRLAALPPEGARPLLRRHHRRRRANLGPAQQLQGGRRGARADERVGDLTPPEQRAADPDRLQRRCCSRLTLISGHLRHECRSSPASGPPARSGRSLGDGRRPWRRLAASSATSAGVVDHAAERPGVRPPRPHRDHTRATKRGPRKGPLCSLTPVSVH